MIRLEVIGEMYEDGRWKEIHRKPIARVQPYDVYNHRQKQARASRLPASPAPSLPPAPSRRLQLMAPPKGEDSRPVLSAPSAVRRLAPSPPVLQGASPFHQCTLPPTGLMALKRGSYPNVSGVTRGSGIRLLPAATVSRGRPAAGVSWSSSEGMTGRTTAPAVCICKQPGCFKNPTALLRATNIFMKDASITLNF